MSIETKMAFRNLWRNPRRSILTMAAIGFACMLLVFMLSFQFGTYDQMISFSVHIQTGDLQVQAKGFHEDQNMRQVIPDPSAVGRILKETQGVTDYTYRSMGFSLASSKDRTYGVMVIGIQPEQEARVSIIKTLMREGEYLAPGDNEGAILGKLLAQNLQVGLGDEVTILGQGRDGSIAATVVKVRGLYSSGQDDFDRGTLQITLDNFDTVYSMRGVVHTAVVVTDNLKEVSRVKKAVAGGVAKLKTKKPLVVLGWSQLMPGLLQGIKMDLFSGLIFYFILIVVVAFSIMNTFLMSVIERTREFGVLLAVGLSPWRLIKLILYESSAMTLLGIAAGTALGAAVAYLFQHIGIPVGSMDEMMAQYGIPDRLYPMLSIYSLTIGPAAVLVITFLTALYPAFKVRKLVPVEAINHP